MHVLTTHVGWLAALHAHAVRPIQCCHKGAPHPHLWVDVHIVAAQQRRRQATLLLVALRCCRLQAHVGKWSLRGHSGALMITGSMSVMQAKQPGARPRVSHRVLQCPRRLLVLLVHALALQWQAKSKQGGRSALQMLLASQAPSAAAASL